jgi:STE24 endopeptidase
VTAAADRRTVEPVIVAVGALVVVGIVAAVWRPWAPRLPGATTSLTTFPADVVDAVTAYLAPRVVAALSARLVAVAVPVALVVLPIGRRLVARIGGDGAGRPLLRAGVLAATLSILVWVAVLPLGVWTGLVHDGAWGLRTAPAALWWRDRVLAGLLEAALTGAVGVGFLLVLRWRPRTWPWHVTWMVTGLIAVLSFVWPVLVAPLFVPTRPLEAGPVREAVEDVLDEAGVGGATIEVAEASTRTTKINAMVTGLGPSRRVVLHDTLLERPLPEIEAVLAHELGHRLHRDVARGVLASAPAVLLGALLLARIMSAGVVQRRVGASGHADPRMIAVAFAAITVMLAVSDPAALWYSRRVEAAADHQALSLSGDPAALIGIQRAFVVRDLAAPDPPVWQVALFSTHPPLGSRIRYAVAYAADQGIPLPDVADYLADEAEVGVPWHRPR